MKRTFIQWLGAGLLGATLILGSDSVAKAQEYWTQYAPTYVSPYRSYYVARPGYSSYYYGDPSYYRSYSVQPYYYSPPVTYGTYYAPTYGSYYGVPNAGYYSAPYGGGQVQVGRLRIGWP